MLELVFLSLHLVEARSGLKLKLPVELSHLLVLGLKLHTGKVNYSKSGSK